MEEDNLPELAIPREIVHGSPSPIQVRHPIIIPSAYTQLLLAVWITWMKQMVISFQGYIGECCRNSSAIRYAAYMLSSSPTPSNTSPAKPDFKVFVLKSEQLKAKTLSLLPAVTRMSCPILISPSSSPTQLGIMMGFPSNTLGVFTRIWKKKEREKKNPESSRPFIIMLKLLLFCRCNRSVLFFRAARA
ncbi:hypothetical protein ARMGADRAFT_156118 [Armillaria gallica]|uniref:Uncharacterized protein n=1 Tax=Armillaria gallica TaxID=47427 RepID=A0A2H3E0R6_ARMGA|nr:hypothetical protein ARMGADRAFT_156118 [Armillaria gallica]